MQLSRQHQRYHNQLKDHSSSTQTQDELTEQAWLNYTLAVVRVYKATFVGRILVHQLRTMSTTLASKSEKRSNLSEPSVSHGLNNPTINVHLDNIIATIISVNETQCENSRKLFNMRRRIDGCYAAILAQQVFTQFRAALDRLALVFTRCSNGDENSNFRFTIEQNARKLEQHLFSVSRTLQMASNLATSVPRALLNNSPILIETSGSAQSLPMQRLCVECKLAHLTLLLHVYKQYARKRLHIHEVTRTYAESGRINRRSINEYLYVKSPDFTIDPLEVTCADTMSTQINECFNITPEFVRTAFCQLLLRAGQMYAITCGLEGPDVVDMWQDNNGNGPPTNSKSEIGNNSNDKRPTNAANSAQAAKARDINKLPQPKSHSKTRNKPNAADDSEDSKKGIGNVANVTNLLKHQNLAISRLEMCVRKAFDGKCWTLAAEACMELLDLYGRTNAYDCLRVLCFYQSCIVSQQMVDMLKCILNDQSQSLLAQMLHCRYDSTIDYIAPERQRFEALCAVSNCWRRVDVDGNFEALLAKLPKNFNIVVLQHNADKSMLYGGVLLAAAPLPSSSEKQQDETATGEPTVESAITPVQNRCQVARVRTDVDQLNNITSRLNDWKVAVTGWIKRGDILGSGWNTRYEDDEADFGSSGANLNSTNAAAAANPVGADASSPHNSSQKLTQASSTAVDQQRGIDEESRLELTLVDIIQSLESYLAPLMDQLKLPEATDTKPPCNQHLVLLADMDLLQMPVEALSWFKSSINNETHKPIIKSVSRDYSLQFLCNRLDSPVADTIHTNETLSESYDRVREMKLTGTVPNRTPANVDGAKTPNTDKPGKDKKQKKKSESKGGEKDTKQEKQKGAKEKAGKDAGKKNPTADSKNKNNAKGGKSGKKSPKHKSAMHADQEPIEPRSDCYLISKDKLSFVADPLREYDLTDYRSPRKIVTDFYNLNIKPANITWRGNALTTPQTTPPATTALPQAVESNNNAEEAPRKSDAAAIAAAAEMFSTPEQWIEVMQTAEWTECFMYYAAQTFFATAMPLLLPQTNLSRVGLVLIFDRMRSRQDVDARLLRALLTSSSVLKDNVTSNTVAAAILSFSGVRSVCLNQWSASSLDNAELFNAIATAMINEYQSSAEAIASVRARNATYTDALNNKSGSILGAPEQTSQQQPMSSAKTTPHEWTRQKFNFVCFGLPNVAFNV